MKAPPHPDLIPYLRRWWGEGHERLSDEELREATKGTFGRAQIELHLAGRDLVQTVVKEAKKDLACIRRGVRRSVTQK